MSNRRRPGSWQEGVAKGFSKLFSRTSSQEKEEESEKSTKEPGDEQERGDTGLSRFFSRGPSLRRRESTEGSQVEEQKSQHEPSVFSRRISQDDKEDTEQSSREEQETNKVFSRQSTKESSQEEEDKTKRKDATPEPDRREDNSSHLMTDSNQNVSSLEQTIYEPDFVTNEQNTPRTKEGIELGLSEDIKVHDSEKQSKENLLHFISNLFHFSPKSAQTNPKANVPHQELRKDNEDAAINDNLHTETLHDGQSLDECNGVSHATSAEQTIDPSSPVISPGGMKPSLGVTEIPCVLIEGEGNVETPSGNDETPASTGTREDTEQTDVESPTNSSKKSPSSNLAAPSVTYGTYRGSKRIRKLIKRRPDISSPIPEKEENSERETPDIAKETDSTALHQIDVLKQVSDLPTNDDHKNDDHKTSSQTIQVEIHSYSNKNSNCINDLQSDTESSNLEPLQLNSKRTPKLSDDLESQERVSNVADNLKVYVTDFPNRTEEEQTILEQKELILPDEDTILPDSTKSETNIVKTLNHGLYPQGEEAIDEVKTIENGKNSKDQQQTIKDRLDLQDNIYPRDYGSLKTHENSIGLITEHQQSDKEKISGNEHYKLRGEHKTSLSEEMSPPETDYEVSVTDMEEPSRGATDPVKSAMDFLPHPGPVLDTPSYIEENAINVEGCQTNEEDMQYSVDRNLQPKKSMKTSNVNWQPMGRESPTSVGELRPNNCPPDEDVTRESPESLQISHMRINNIVEGEELDNISLIRGDSNVHHQSAPMTIEEFKKGVGGNSGAFDSSHPVLESDLFTTKSAREKSDGKKNGNFIHTKEHTQPGSDIEYNEPEFTANAEAEANNDNQSVTDSEDNSSTLVNWTPHDIQSNEIRTLSPSFSEDVTRSMKLPDVTHVPRPRLNFTEDICAYPVNADLSSEGNLVANNEFNDFHPSFRVTENNSPVKPKNASNTLEVHHQSAHEAPMTIEEFKKGVTGKPGTFDYSHPVLESDLFTSKSAREHSDGNKNGNFIQTQEHTQNGSDIEYNESEFTANAEAEANNDDQSVTDSEDNSSTLVNWTPHDMQSKKIRTLSPSFSEDVTRSLKLPDATYLPRPRLNFTEDVCTSPVTTDSTSDGNMVANNEFNDFHPSFRVTENNSPVKQTTPALSFDNSIDFLSSPHTTSSQSTLSPAGYISLRADSPLPSSDGIDSGVVSSQAYTPEENTIVNISPSELYNNLEFASNQKPNLINLIEPNKEILERSVSANSHFDSTNKLGILPTQTEEHVSDKKEGIPTRNSSYTNDNEIPLHRCLDNDESMDKNVPSVYRECNDSLNVKPGDVYVAKVCVKSVDVEEVKITPCSLKTEVVAISKLVAPRFEPEFISIPNVPSSPPDKDSENLRNNNFSPHSEPTDGIVSNVDNIQTKPRDSRGLLQKYQQEQDDTANPSWIFENNQNFMPNDEDMSLSPDVRREPAGNLPYPKSKHPCISSDAERVNNFMEVIPEMQPNDRNLSDTIDSYGNVKNVTVAFVNGKNEETSDRPNVVNHDASLELHNANYIPSGEINANALTPQDPSLQSTITNQKIDLKINSTEVTYDQKHINDVIVTIRPHKKASTISEETKSLLKPEYNSEETENAVTELTPNVQSDFSSGTTSQDIEQIADYGNDIVENQRLYPSETNPEYDSSFSVHNGFYVEVGESDEETVDEENDADGEGLDSDSQSSMQLRRVPFYPISLSPIYENDSSSEDVLSNRASPRCIEGQDESTNANDHTSILSLLQSVSNRLKEEGISSLDNENTCNKVELTQTTNETENATSPSFKDAAYINDKGEKSTESSQGASRHGLFITKSIIDNRPVLGLGRKSIFLHVNPQVGTYGSKSSSESTPLSDSESKTPELEEKSSTLTETELSTDLSDSAPLKPHATSPLPDVTVQASDMEPKPPFSPKSVYYQYFNDVSNQAEHTDNRKSNKQEKMDSSQKFSPQKADSLMRSLSNSDAIKSNPRPGKVVISDLFEHEMKFEMYSDILDATCLIFPNGVNIRVIRGCWILYEKPDFQGQAHVLEEGEAVLQQLWGPPESKSRPEQVIIGSLKRVTKDYLPEVVLTRLYGTSGAPICLRTEIPSLKKHLDNIPRSLEVIAGVWLAYTDPQFTGSVSVLEEGSILPSVPESDIQSLRPLKLGGLKVQLPSQPRIILYQKPYFEGWSKEITDHVYSIKKMICEDHVIGSIKVIGGIWVGYEKERYKGTQYLLEEGEYEDWNAWGGISDTLQSIRYLHADVLETSVTLFESEAEDGKLLDLFNQAVPDLESSGYRRETQCIHVKKGIWVAYQQKYFCGEQYILEKGRYKSCMDWGGKTNTIMSIRPVMLEPLGKEEPKHMMAAFSDENFQGRCEYHIEETCEFPEFPPRSFKVLRGCWLLCYQADTCENLCVLEEGNFPDLVTCGCPAAVIKCIKPIDYVFAEPAISLFALDLCEGRELSFDEPVTSVLSKDLNFYTQSVWIRRGLWIAFEGPNFLGQQLLLEAGQILNWTEYSGWKAIGSLRPLKQTPVYFRIKNRHNDKYLTLTGTLTDTSATFVCVSARNGQNTQIWYFCRGLLKSKATDSCLDVIGGKNLPGAKVSLWVENGKHRQKWRINKDGTITSYLSDDLVLDLKGGNFYDQNYIVVNRVQQDVATQKWDIEIL